MNPEFKKAYEDAIKFLESEDVDEALKELGLEDEEDNEND